MGSFFLSSGSPSQRTRRGRLLLWLAPAGVVCLFPFFFIGGPDWSAGPLTRAVWNLGHPVFFALLTLTVRPWRFLTGWKLWALATLGVLVLGLGVEFAQSLGDRQIDRDDVFRNLTGLWAVLALLPWVGFRRPSPVRDWLLRALALALLSIDPVMVAGIAIQQIQISQGLPALYNFQHDHPERFWRGNVAPSSRGDCGPLTGHALAIDLTTRRYTGASLDNLPADWRGYDELVFVLWNPQSHAIPVTLRINDLDHERQSNQFHDRFNRTFEIQPGINQIQQPLKEVAEAPRAREMDMDRIRRLMFFTSNLDRPARLCLGQLRLVGGDDAPVDMG